MANFNDGRVTVYEKGYPPQTTVLAGLGRRLCALIYETLLLMAVILVLGGIFQLIFPTVSMQRELSITLFIYEVVLVFGYFGVCWVKGGQTLAMKTWRLILRQKNHQPLRWRQALLRYTIVFVAVLPLAPVSLLVSHHVFPNYYTWLALAWAALPYLWALLDKDQQFLHDRVIGARLMTVPRPSQAK